ncbi:MAG: hypothetical protein U0441_21935 [Polyangiaceae bacterium]
MNHRNIVFAALLALAGCSAEGRVRAVNAGPSQSDPDAERKAASADPGDAPGLLVTADRHLGRPLTAITVLDLHIDARDEAEAFAELRRRAADLGADAVTSAVFEPPDGDEPAHVSGIAVRFAPDDTRRFDSLGEIDIVTSEDADDKGFERLLEKAREMGADEVRFLRFEHSADGGKSHLKGTAVRYHD